MRKLIAIIAIMLIGMVSYGQEAGTYDKKLDYGVTWAKYDGTSADVITTTDTLWSYTYFKNSYKPLKYDVYLNLDKTGGTTNVVNVYLKAKNWSEQTAWDTLKTVSWSGASDTIIIMTERTTAKQYQYYQVDIKGADNTLLASIKELFAKFWE